MAKYAREPINGFTHLFGAILSFAGLLILVIKTTLENPSPIALTAVIIFGISLILFCICYISFSYCKRKYY